MEDGPGRPAAISTFFRFACVFGFRNGWFRGVFDGFCLGFRGVVGVWLRVGSFFFGFRSKTLVLFYAVV